MLDGNEGVSQRNELSGRVAGPSVQAGSIHGGIRFDTEPRPSIPTPAQLPFRAVYAGRDNELAGLRRLTVQDIDAGRPFLLVIAGAGGVGKTALALNWLHQIREEYADGQLFVDLRGLSGDGRPMPPGEALGRFLRALGISTESIPATVDERATLFRSLTTDSRLIIMLDNAASIAQVRPLLPGPGPALVVVTTRKRLQGLAMDGARFLHLPPLDNSGSLELLSRIVGRERIAAEPDAALSLVSLCGGLPLAVCASATRLTARSRWTIERVAQELIDETRRLSILSMEDDLSVRASLDLSYRALPDDAARLYRTLGRQPGYDFNTETAAALAGINPGEAALLLDLLVAVNLLEEASTDQYRFHDLFRLHAREKLKEITF